MSSSPIRMPPPEASSTAGNGPNPSDLTRDVINDAMDMLDDYFESQPTVFVSGGIPIYYNEDNHKKRITPELFVVRDIPRKRRNAFLRWSEGKMPDVILEIGPGCSSPIQVGPKASLYFTLGVQEYYIFDTSPQKPEGGPLYGMVRDDAGFTALPLDEHGKLQSAILGLDLYVEQPDRGDWRLRFYDPDSMQVLKTRRERMSEERNRREEAERRASAAEAELRKLREELMALRSGAKV